MCKSRGASVGVGAGAVGDTIAIVAVAASGCGVRISGVVSGVQANRPIVINASK